MEKEHILKKLKEFYGKATGSTSARWGIISIAMDIILCFFTLSIAVGSSIKITSLGWSFLGIGIFVLIIAVLASVCWLKDPIKEQEHDLFQKIMKQIDYNKKEIIEELTRESNAPK